MALSPFKSPQSPLSRSRSSSCSSPVRNRIVYQEVYSIGANTLVRSFSCDQVFDKDGSGRTFQTTQIHVQSFITPEKKIHIVPDEGKPKQPRRLVLESPADNVDSKKEIFESSKEPSVVKTAIKKTLMFTFLTITSACALYFYMTYRECYYVWDLERTEFELKENIFGQNEALAKIKSVLKMVNHTNDLHTMVFTGGVGVGKTYSSSIISRNFPWSSNKFLTYSEHFSEDLDKLKNQKLLTCGCNLLIVDDLSVNSVKEAINLIVLMNNLRKNNENLLIILIFHSQTTKDTNEIQTQFKNSFLHINYISFQPLERGDVEKCFKSEIKRQGVLVSDLELGKLVDNKMKIIDVIKGTSGCKGVDAEVASYYKKTVT